jgi:hypothetical protein
MMAAKRQRLDDGQQVLQLANGQLTEPLILFESAVIRKLNVAQHNSLINLPDNVRSRLCSVSDQPHMYTC